MLFINEIPLERSERICFVLLTVIILQDISVYNAVNLLRRRTSLRSYELFLLILLFLLPEGIYRSYKS